MTKTKKGLKLRLFHLLEEYIPQDEIWEAFYKAFQKCPLCKAALDPITRCPTIGCWNHLVQPSDPKSIEAGSVHGDYPILGIECPRCEFEEGQGKLCHKCRKQVGNPLANDLNIEQLAILTKWASTLEFKCKACGGDLKFVGITHNTSPGRFVTDFQCQKDSKHWTHHYEDYASCPDLNQEKPLVFPSPFINLCPKCYRGGIDMSTDPIICECGWSITRAELRQNLEKMGIKQPSGRVS